MSVVLPNSFSCAARTAVFETPEPVDFRHLAQPGLPAEVHDQLRANRFLVTTSRVSSTVSEHHSIDFVETLLKVPVTVRGTEYLFPVVTYVDHEYSLIRGYLLGFHKLLRGRPADADPLTLCLPGLDIDLRADEKPAGEEPLPREQEFPMLLWTNYSVGRVYSRGFATLAIEDYERKSLVPLDAIRKEQTIAGRDLTVSRLYEIQDTFVIRRTVPLEGEGRLLPN
ncbi:hypothetical protein Slala03_76650 [Streptomyces lavendulae subsp. lavendulae]|nr:hypothetical protein Slala03_76650 [Streptomyces lavendulae subsp. lavendulae]